MGAYRDEQDGYPSRGVPPKPRDMQNQGGMMSLSGCGIAFRIQNNVYVQFGFLYFGADQAQIKCVT